MSTEPFQTDPYANQSVDAVTTYEGVTAPDTPAEEVGPMYRMIGTNRIPVSKSRGKLWNSRRGQAEAGIDRMKKAWDEALKYYRHDHTRDGARDADLDTQGGKTLQGTLTETENIVFANVSALVPMLFTKNPDAEFSVEDEEDKPYADLLEKLVNTLAAKKTQPGLNLKRKVKRNIVATTLFNCGWFEVGWTFREQSSNRALEELQILSEELLNAKDEKAIKECEGKLRALEETIDMLTPAGPWVKVRRATDVLIDPTATELDLTDANWIMVKDYIPSAVLYAKFAQKEQDGDQYMSIFEPTHVLKLGSGTATSGDRGQTDNFQLFDYDKGEASKYGYTDDRSFRQAQMTCVYYVWDKTTRRCELYNSADWCYPIWVWDDPYRLDQFFTLVPMEFHTDPSSIYAKGEVTYYLDQQDSINTINNEWNKIREFAAGKIVFDTEAIKDQNLIDGIINGTSDTRALGIKMPENKSIKDVIGALLPPSADAIKFFDKKPILEAIDRISGVASVQRGVEYKTNTTNRAIESYESQMQTRADEKMDAIEDSVGTVLWLIGQMCMQFMSQAEVASLLGDKRAALWENKEPDAIRSTFTPRVVGGSSLKPSSRAKKEQALQISQIVGQFAGATPIAAVIALKVLSKAFDSVIISVEDWELIYKAIMGGGAGNAEDQGQQQAAGASAGPPQRPQAGPPQAASAGGGGGGAIGAGKGGLEIKGVQGVVEEVGRLIDGLPQEIRQLLGIGLARGQSMEQIVGGLLAKLQQSAAA